MAYVKQKKEHMEKLIAKAVQIRQVSESKESAIEELDTEKSDSEIEKLDAEDLVSKNMGQVHCRNLLMH
jgi:hypothetical protein